MCAELILILDLTSKQIDISLHWATYRLRIKDFLQAKQVRNTTSDTSTVTSANGSATTSSYSTTASAAIGIINSSTFQTNTMTIKQQYD